MANRMSGSLPAPASIAVPSPRLDHPARSPSGAASIAPTPSLPRASSPRSLPSSRSSKSSGEAYRRATGQPSSGDRKRVVEGKGVSVRVVLGGSRIIYKPNHFSIQQYISTLHHITSISIYVLFVVMMFVYLSCSVCFFFFFQAEDGIRDAH